MLDPHLFHYSDTATSQFTTHLELHLSPVNTTIVLDFDQGRWSVLGESLKCALRLMGSSTVAPRCGYQGRYIYIYI